MLVPPLASLYINFVYLHFIFEKYTLQIYPDLNRDWIAEWSKAIVIDHVDVQVTSSNPFVANFHTFGFF